MNPLEFPLARRLLRRPAPPPPSPLDDLTADYLRRRAVETAVDAIEFERLLHAGELGEADLERARKRAQSIQDYTDTLEQAVHQEVRLVLMARQAGYLKRMDAPELS